MKSNTAFVFDLDSTITTVEILPILANALDINTAQTFSGVRPAPSSLREATTFEAFDNKELDYILNEYLNGSFNLNVY